MSELLTCIKHDSEFVKVAVIYHVNVPRLQPCPVCLEITGLQARVLESGQRITDLQIESNLTLSNKDRTIAELTAKLDAVRGLADGLSQVCGDWGRSEGISKRILAILDAPTKPKDAEWQCEVCHSRYAEYVNGCPHCWEAGLRSKVTKPKEARNGEE